jgi:hypothetical protein
MYFPASSPSRRGLHTKSWKTSSGGAPRLIFVISLDAAVVSVRPSWLWPIQALGCAPVLTENNKLNDLKPLVLHPVTSAPPGAFSCAMHGLDLFALRSDIQDMALDDLISGLELIALTHFVT